ncbi:uncharacterized protein PAE49_018721 [Odontesthes bonariensis]|uniref:uncharacterized protein LOC142365988 n=1 Tax=Odontesthes bonariensis TaxID=219752 RepID=UPI003F587AF2
MAEVRQYTARRAHDFALKVYNRYLLESPSKQERGALHASSLTAGFLLDDIKIFGLNGVENAADKMASGVSPDSYTRVAQLVSGVDTGLENENIDENYHYRELEEHSLSSKPRVQRIERNLPPYRNYAKFIRTLSNSYRRQQSSCCRYLYPGHGQLVFIREYSDNGTRSEPLYRTKTGYYEILEVSSTATQAQIKTAYYKQSFIYHPDRNASSDEATVRFSEISEAYMVLGNKGLRKKYDRGLLNLSDLTTGRPSARDTTGGSASRHTDSKRSVMGIDSRGGIFDFDTFFKSHYSEQLQRQKEIRVRKEEILKRKQTAVGDKKMERMMEFGVGMLMVLAVGLLLSLNQR